MRHLTLFVLVALMTASFTSCNKDKSGCTDPKADNYDVNATVSDTVCTYQKRFVGDFSGQIGCKGLFKTAFTMADMTIEELINRKEVNIIIQSTIGPLPVRGIITSTNSMKVDATLTGIRINLKTLSALAPDKEIDAHATIKSDLTISDDNKTLTGLLKIALIPQETFSILGLAFPANNPIPDECDFTGTRK
jgi:hypothetical protein